MRLASRTAAAPQRASADTYFLSLMAGESDALLGFSNVITVTRGRSVNGNVPNAECAEWTNDDRSEPYVGAMVVRQHWRRHGELRLVELLYDDLVAWHEWTLARRALQPHNLISVGSDVVSTPPFDGHTKQAAIWETGMDNSPMYDAVTWDANQSKLLIFDVGMTSEFLGETEALAELATALNRTADAAKYEREAEAMAKQVRDTLWSADDGLFLNFQVDTNQFNKHASPTSFYPLLSGTATEEQALTMVRRWLTNHSGFCLNTTTASPPVPPSPRPPPAFSHGLFISLRYSSTFSDNAVCVSSDKCRASGGGGEHHPECCPPRVWDDGAAKSSTYEWMRPEGYVLPGDAEFAEHRDVPTVDLKMYYSKARDDNFLGINATRDYVVVRAAAQSGPAGLGAVAARIFASPPNDTYVPLDLYWNHGRQDMQTVGSAETRKWLQGYTFVQRLGYVRRAIQCTTAQPGCIIPHALSPCLFGLPSTPNVDPAYRDNDYWRGRVWGPLNLLVYWALSHRRYRDLPEVAAARRRLTVVSREALLVVRRTH